MSENESERKTDRRTLYTKQIIKETILDFLHQKSFEKITVTEVCQIAQINRGTFYLHYQDLYDVLDEMTDEVLLQSADHSDTAVNSTGCNCHCAYPFCQNALDNEKYGVLFFNDSLSAYIVDKISASRKEPFINELMETGHLTYRQAEALFIFQINGCLAVSKAYYKNGAVRPSEVHSIIDRFIHSGTLSCIAPDKL